MHLSGHYLLILLHTCCLDGLYIWACYRVTGKGWDINDDIQLFWFTDKKVQFEYLSLRLWSLILETLKNLFPFLKQKAEENRFPFQNNNKTEEKNLFPFQSVFLWIHIPEDIYFMWPLENPPLFVTIIPFWIYLFSCNTYEIRSNI